jgi:hypothetical protein
MTPLVPAGAGLALVVLRRVRFAPRWSAVTLALLPVRFGKRNASKVQIGELPFIRPPA